MQAPRAIYRRLIGAFTVAALLAACEGEIAKRSSYALESAAGPFRNEAPYELGPFDTCRWLEDGRLFVELVSEYAGIQAVTRTWIEFQPPQAPHVEVASWNEELSSNARWTRSRIQGRSWVSSNGEGLRDPPGSDLTVDMEWTCWISGSDQRGGRRLLMHAEQLAGSTSQVLTPAIAELVPWKHSFLDIEAVPLEPGDTCRWLEDGRLFLELVRTPERGFPWAVTRLWIDFDPGRAPAVSASYWVGDRQLRPAWSGRNLRGRAWMNSDGTGLGAVGGPDLIVEVDYSARVSGSYGRFELALHLRSEDLVRER